MRRQLPATDDLRERSSTESRDEELLLQLFRRSSAAERSELLFRLTRLHFVPFFTAEFSRDRNEQDTTYMQEELEEQLRLICPRDHLVSACPTFEHPVIFSSLWATAWGKIAPVILGSDEHDGQRADDLYQAVIACSRGARVAVDPDFSRIDALRLIEDWREQVLRGIFSPPTDDVR